MYDSIAITLLFSTYVYDSKSLAGKHFVFKCLRWRWVLRRALGDSRGGRGRGMEKASPERGLLFFYPKFRIPSLTFNRANFLEVGLDVTHLESAVITSVLGRGA